MHNKIIMLGSKLGEFLNADSDLYKIDYIVIHGQLSQEEKAGYLKFFMADSNDRIHDICVLLATSGVANVGINSKEIHTAICVEFPPSIHNNNNVILYDH